MRTYRVFFLARGDEVVGSRSFEAADDHEARSNAEEFCRDHPGCVAVEIWDGGWPLYRHLRAVSETQAPPVPFGQLEVWESNRFGTEKEKI